MKTTFSIILFCAVYSCSELSVSAQDDYNTQARNFFLDDSTDTPRLLTFPPYIFEGIVIKSMKYLCSNDGKIYTENEVSEEDLLYGRKQIYGMALTSYTVLITKVLRGNDSLKSGTVEIIVNGLWAVSAVPPFVGFSNGYVGLFFCRNTTYPSLGVAVDNPIHLQLQYEHNRGITYYPKKQNTPAIIQGLGSSFTSQQNLYIYLKRQPNITLTDTSVHPVIKEYLETGKLNFK